MRHARHDQILAAIESVAIPVVTGKDQKYIVIVYDGPNYPGREASFVSNVDVGDVAQVCDAVAKQIKQRAN